MPDKTMERRKNLDEYEHKQLKWDEMSRLFEQMEVRALAVTAITIFGKGIFINRPQAIYDARCRHTPNTIKSI